ncbi:sulfotransferase domain-containing protein [cf. Phormidesmis sp. LEGE 11477]|uniref:sulfotransferase domain-containing protein n=1 Tax=cf. Phormidesmis sp. LEGE 11477 TaxID=1828680 RepID=UPI00187ED99A|nr:sulfotransferase domain-containing protein [cf. Phormidesmis sp. LEGE 11477]MBE9059595.1 sulfotransferase domain-containing protein [cf. Phormidesmis sp. LEGE 11477]
MSFVDFVIVGAMKSGTTSLSEILSMHPRVCFCENKEPHFFSKVSNWQDHIEEYKELYNPTDNQICGEASTTYTFYPNFGVDPCQAIYDFNPHMKLIYILRDPIDRIVSQYVHRRGRGTTLEDSFEKEVLTRPEYINISRYYVQIKPYIERFGREQVLLLTFEEFISNRNSSLGKVFNFLGIESSLSDYVDDIHANRSVGEYKNSAKIDEILQGSLAQGVRSLLPEYVAKPVFDAIRKPGRRKIDDKPVVTERLEQILRDFVMLDVLEIEKLIGRELNEWTTTKKKNFYLRDKALKNIPVAIE